MYILSKLSWDKDRDKGVQPTVTGYYDSVHPWNDIPVFYLDYHHVHRLIDFYMEHPEYGRSLTLVRDKEILVFVHNGTKTEVKPETITPHKRLPTLVWPIAFEERCFDVAVNEDDRLFTAQDIQEAMIDGIEVGMVAGFEGVKTINGLSPKDYAILYARDLAGS